MIEAAKVIEKLRTKYGNLENVADGVFRAVDEYAGRGYAIRYFDLADDLLEKVDHLREYQEGILSDTYFSDKTSSDLRWNHYLYFVSSLAVARSDAFAHAKAKAEDDREYSRKTVILENEIDSLLMEPLHAAQAMPADLSSMWANRLEEKGLTYVLDEDVSVPEAVRRIESGVEQKAKKIITPLTLTPAEQAAAQCFVEGITVSGFRPYPTSKSHKFGRVNLIVGSNGTGKTSLLEAIEFLFCGQNQRPGELIPRTSVAAAFVGGGDNLITSTTTASQRLRTRHSQWYAKTEIKKLTLSESFGKFNFLDTDAAVRLSVDDSEERIGRDVMRLLLGSGAEKLNDRLERVRSKLEEFAKERDREIMTYRQLLVAAQQHLETLKNAPQVSDALFADLCVALSRLNWRVLPPTKQRAASVRENLQVALTATKFLVRCSVDTRFADEEALLKRQATVVAAIESSTEISAKLRDATLSLAQTHSNHSRLKARLIALEALLPYAEARYSKYAAEMFKCRQRVDDLTSRLSPFGQDEITMDLDDISATSLARATTAAIAILTEAEKRLAGARRALKAVEDTQASISVLRQRLLSIAQELLSKVPSPDHCPICHTEFQVGQLQERILSGTIDDSETRLAELQAAVLLDEKALEQAQRRSAALKKLFAFLGDQPDTTVGNAVDAVSKARAELSLEQARLKELEAYFRDLAVKGLSDDDLARHLKTAEVEQLTDASEILSRRAAAGEALKAEEDLQESFRAAIEAANGACARLASSSGVDINATPAELNKQLRKQAADLDAIVKTKGVLTSIVEINNSLEIIALQLEQAQSHLQNLTTAMSKEEANSDTAAIEEKNIAELTKQIAKGSTEEHRLWEASKFLNELLTLGIGGELASQILSENATVIGDIFAAIHTPNEFEVVVEEGRLVIRRRVTGRNVSLSEMSAGQRAAYALSLFLAMNARLMSGPRVILFDDPIAHVDDMNVLSFLDHLRDLSIKGTRQIFFATADTKLAGLFRQKFRFLGKEEFRDIELTR